MHASVPSATLIGVDGRPVRVEVHASTGLPGFTLVGLPDTTCREARDRVRAALLSSGLSWPSLRVTVNLAPSGLRKMGAGLDLAIAVGLLVVTEQLPPGCLDGRAFVGELGLDGSIRPVPGALPLIDALVEPEVVVPAACTV
ncbi:MAG TPA: magnesium chelatase domain-containing protein, partial [Acidimicrobiales bacterium]